MFGCFKALNTWSPDPVDAAVLSPTCLRRRPVKRGGPVGIFPRLVATEDSARMCIDETVSDPTNHAHLWAAQGRGDRRDGSTLMDHYRRSVRRLLLVGACVASALVGLVAVWLFAPTGFLRLDTSDLLAVFALLLLPVLTVWSVRADRAAQAAAEERATAFQPIAPVTPESAPAQGQRVVRKSVIHEPAYLPDPARERV